LNCTQKERINAKAQNSLQKIILKRLFAFHFIDKLVTINAKIENKEEMMSCAEMCTMLNKSYSVSFPPLVALTNCRNSKSTTCRQILAEVGYGAIAIASAVEFVAKAVCALVLIPVAGILYFLGNYFRRECLTALGICGINTVVVSLAFSFITTGLAGLALKRNLTDSQVELKEDLKSCLQICGKVQDWFEFPVNPGGVLTWKADENFFH
jgi:hypothetical protein